MTFFKTKIKFKVCDFFIALLFLAVIAISFFPLLKKTEQNNFLFVKSPYGKFIYNLSENAEYKIEGALGFSTVKIFNKTACITNSPCPNKTCIECTAISKNGQWTACLPNGVVIYIQSDDKEFDAVTN